MPSFKYHPDPIGTGSFEAAELTCLSCGEARSYVYVGPAYSKGDVEGGICPWCISSGLAHDRFGVEFTDVEGAIEPNSSLPEHVKQEIAFRTPGFNSWQPERWLVHCGDACAFLGPAGRSELMGYADEDLIDSLRLDSGLDDAKFRDYMGELDKEAGPTAYVFRCIHCGLCQGYSDSY